MPKPATTKEAQTIKESYIKSHNLKNREKTFDATSSSPSRRSSESSEDSKPGTDQEIVDAQSTSPSSSSASSRDGSPINSNLTDLNQLLEDYTQVAIQHIQRHQADSYV